MEKVIQLQRKIAPEIITIIEDRYNVLRHVQYAQPVGRRALAAILGMGERAVRAQVDFLKNAGFVAFSALGMTVTAEGSIVLTDLAEYIRAMHGLTQLEEELRTSLGLRNIVIIPGNSDEDDTVVKELGRAAAGVLAECLKEDMTLAVSGGSTMAAVAQSINFTAPSTMIVPARGGLGERVEIQANTIAAVMASKIGGKYRQLYVPDGVSEETLAVILAEDAQVKSVVEIIKKADILIHSVGQVRQMAKRRGIPAQTIEDLLQSGAAGEALGQYCTLTGESVYVTSNIGLLLNDLTGIGTVIAVAGGREKAKAILAVVSASRQDILVTDEAAALAMRELLMAIQLN